MTHLITLLPQNISISAPDGSNLLDLLRSSGFAPAAPCGGMGTCGKCTVLINGTPTKACSVTVERDLTVTLPREDEMSVLTAGVGTTTNSGQGYRLAFDIGTTTVAGILLDPAGQEVAASGVRNPQAAYGADVVSRIRAAENGQQAALTTQIRACLEQMTTDLCRRGSIPPEEVTLVSVVGNPAMQQLFLGVSTENLARPPFAPKLTRLEQQPAREVLPCLPHAVLLTLPDISGFVGADTLGCLLSTAMDTAEEMTLLVDIGTNGEMVLGNRHRLIACSTAAGPALEGAHIHCGMTAAPGAIDRVSIENGAMVCHTIGDVTATGICGSGLISAVAAALELGLLNNRGKILAEDGQISLTAQVFLTQEDIRQVQLAKGAIAAGIMLLADRMGIPLEEISRVYLAGAFGTYLDPKAACRIGLLPVELDGKIETVGNAALAGAALLTQDAHLLRRVQSAADRTEDLNLSNAPDFPRTFAKCMRFDAEQ